MIKVAFFTNHITLNYFSFLLVSRPSAFCPITDHRPRAFKKMYTTKCSLCAYA